MDENSELFSAFMHSVKLINPGSIPGRSDFNFIDFIKLKYFYIKYIYFKFA